VLTAHAWFGWLGSWPVLTAHAWFGWLGSWIVLTAHAWLLDITVCILKIYVYTVLRIIIIIIIIIIINFVSCHRPFLPGTSLEPAVIPTAQASSATLQYFPYYV
jgi:hypothetical protein